MDVLVMIIQLIVALSFLVGVHEAGHMIAARLFGMRVEKFSIGFPPKLFGFKKGDTEYQLGMIPLGGFVKISGMVDESLDTKNLSEEPEPWEFRAKPAWQRLIVMMGGIIVNVITGIVIFIVLLNIYGNRYIALDKLKHGIIAHEIARDIGLQDGDIIIGIDGQKVKSMQELLKEAALVSKGHFDIIRDGQEMEVPIPGNLADAFSDQANKGRFLSPNSTFSITGLQKDYPLGKSPAQQAGLQAGDSILSIGGNAVITFADLRNELQAAKNEKVEVVYLRNGKRITKVVQMDSLASLGVEVNLNLSHAVVYEKYGFLETIPKGTGQAFEVLIMNIRAFGKIFKGEMSFRKSVGGPIKIATVFGSEYVPYQFWQLVGLLSMVLAFMNFLPIPALDGGHVMFLSYELITGKKPGDKFLENAQKVGMILLLSLMAFIIGNDIVNLF